MYLVSTKGRNAIKAMKFIACYGNNENIPLAKIAESENMSLKYLEIIMRMLVKEKMVEGVSGKGGGYRLCRQPQNYTIGEILRLTEDTLAVTPCSEHNSTVCDKTACCSTYKMWVGVTQMINNYFDSITLYDLITNNLDSVIGNQFIGKDVNNEF